MARLSESEAREKIREVGLRVTPPRLAVLRLLATGERALSHSEVVEKLGEGPWDQATVYRNLKKLVEVGLARITSHVGGLDRYELSESLEHKRGVHPHFACRSCGAVSCLPETQIDVPASESWRLSLRGAEVQFVGVCPSCVSVS